MERCYLANGQESNSNNNPMRMLHGLVVDTKDLRKLVDVVRLLLEKINYPDSVLAAPEARKEIPQ